MFAKLKEYVQKIFKNQYSTMIAGALIAHLGLMLIIVNIFNPSYGVGLLLFWTYIWMVDCSKKTELSGFAQALVCGPVGWVLLPGCLNPIALRKSYEPGGKKTSFFWAKGCALALAVSQAFHTVRSYLMQLSAVQPEKSGVGSAGPAQPASDLSAPGESTSAKSATGQFISGQSSSGHNTSSHATTGQPVQKQAETAQPASSQNFDGQSQAAKSTKES